MKKLLPLACIVLLAACSDWNEGRTCYNPTCGHAREPLSERSFGSNRGINNMVIEYNDHDYKGSCCHCDHKMEGCDKHRQGDGMKHKKRDTSASADPGKIAPAAGTQPKKKGLFF